MSHREPDEVKKKSLPGQRIKVIIERHLDGYIAYPLGIEGAIVGEGDSYEEALAEVESAIHAHIETLGEGVLEDDDPPLEVFTAEVRVDTTPKIKNSGDELPEALAKLA